MQRYDGHTHLRVLEADPYRLLSQLEQAGMHGASVISVPPPGYTIMNTTADYETRVADVLAFALALPMGLSVLRELKAKEAEEAQKNC